MKHLTKMKVFVVCVLIASFFAFAACGHQCSFDEWTTIVEATHTTTGLKQAICSCGESQMEEIPMKEEHAYSAWQVVKEAACTEEGLEERICICGHKDSRAIPAAHDMLEESIAVDATCEKDGLKAFTCTLCKETIAEEIIPATGHKAKTEWTVAVEAGCETEGKENLCCENCETVLETKAIPANGHSYEGENDGWVLADDNDCATADTKSRTCTTCGEVEEETVPVSHRWESVRVTKPATCTSDGIESGICTLCGTVENVLIPATGHNYEWATEEATCTANGVKKDICASCGDVRATEVIPATGHSFVEVIDVEATCSVPGAKHTECSVCKALDGEKEAITVDHDFGEWSVTVPATCKTKGEQERLCCCCGAVDKEVIEIVEHIYDWGYAREEDAPTCTADGKISWLCQYCGDVQGYKTEKALGHSYETAVTAPTCTEKGYTTYTCTACADEYVDDWTETAEHPYGHWNVTREATCTKPGEQVRWCSVCKAENKEEIPVIKHTYEWKVTTPAICDKAGEERNICVCGDYTATKRIDALGHDLGDAEVETAATCTKDGVSVQRCQREGCKYEEKTTIEATHIWATAQVLAEPTCTKEGKAVHYCTVCGEKGEVVLDKINHNMAWVEVTLVNNVWKDTKATCTNTGKATYKCTECDYNTGATKLTEKTAHTPAEEWVVEEPTCTTNGRKHLHCVDCNAEIKSQVLLATGHADINWVDDNKTGVSNYVCVCGKVFDKMSIGLVIEGDTLVSVGTCTTKAVYVPTTVTKIGAGAFDSCANLTTIYLPAGLTEIGENAFRDCKALVHIDFDGSNAAWETVAKGANWDKNTGKYTVY